MRAAAARPPDRAGGPPAAAAPRSLRTRWWSAAAIALVTVLALLGGLAHAGVAAGPQRVLILNSFGHDFSPYGAVASTFRTGLAEASARPIEFLQVSLETVRTETPDEEPVVDYIRALCARRGIDLVALNGEPAVRFWFRHRADLLPSTPALLAGIEERHMRTLDLLPGDAAVTVHIDTPGLLRHILQVLPGTENVYVVIGNSPLERFWLGELRRDWEPFARQVQVTFLNDLPFDEMLRRAATLPPRSALLFALMLVDVAGVPHEQESAVTRLHDVANAPLFGWSDNLLGHGVVGGRLVALGDVGRQAARAAERMLAGEPPAAADLAVVGAGRPAYDWRELRRWDIPPERLPPDRRVLYQPGSILRQYRWAILVALVIIAAQMLAIAGLLVARHRRRQAEEETLRLRRELAHAARVSVMGQLTSSLAHELNQPLGAILRNAEAADLLLDRTPPDLGEVRAILADIRKDDQRAGGVIDGIRKLVRGHELEMTPVDLEGAVEAVAALVRPDAQARGVTLAIDMSPGLPAVRGNPVQLQQVLLNLIINGMESMEGVPEGARTLSVRGRRESDEVAIEVRDNGPGIRPEALPHMFENFYTTKAGGMGMGLAISRRIVEAHGGRIAAENGAQGGATLRVTLPVAGGAP